jgi:inner membrane protein
VDPVTHSLTGATLARAGLHRTTPLATLTLVLAANAPDVDAIAMTQGTYAALAFRRGITHGPVAVPLLALGVAGAVLAWDRLWRRRRDPHGEPARPLAIAALALIGTLTHAPLDWLNTYGIRFLMPFSERWFYGDAVFIIDPWLWLLLAAPLAMIAAASWQRRLWILVAVVGSLLVFLAPGVPMGARVLWVAGVAAIASLHWSWRRGGGPDPDRLGRAALVAAGAYILAMAGADAAASRLTARTAEAAGLQPHALMVAPVPANPFAGEVVVVTVDAYHTGSFRWLRSPRVVLDAPPIPMGPRTDEVLAALRLQDVRDFLRWSRFPFVRVEAVEEGTVVRFRDARYPTGMRGGLGGIDVRIGADRPPVDGAPD